MKIAWAACSVLLIMGLVVSACAPTAAPTPAPARAPAADAPTPVPAGAAPTPAPAPAKPSPAPGITPAPPAAAAPAAPSADKPRYGGVLTSAVGGDPPGLDPHQESTYAVIQPVGPFYNNLIQYDPLDQKKIIPDLAERWEASADGLTYTFYLRKGVQWHDGRPFTGEDVKYSLDRIRLKFKGMRTSPRQTNLEAVKEVTVADPYTVKVALKYPSASFISLVANPWNLILPKHVLEAEGQEALTRKALGTGPLKFKEFIRGVSLEGVKNPDYFVSGRPYLDGYRTMVIPDKFSMVVALRTGRILLYRYPGLLPTEAAKLKKELGDDIVIEGQPYLVKHNASPNWRRPPLNDVRVRQALSLASDRKAYWQIIAQGEGLVSGPMSQGGSWGLPPETLAALPGYSPDREANLARARKLLEEAGFKDGFRTTITTRADLSPGSIATAEFLVSAWREIGVKAEMRILETAAFYRTIEAADFDTMVMSFGMPVDDPDLVFGEHYVAASPRNYNRYENPRIEELFQKQARTLDPKERKKIVDGMQQIVLTDVAKIVFGFPITTLGWWRDVRNFRTPIHHFLATRLQDVWLAK